MSETKETFTIDDVVECLSYLIDVSLEHSTIDVHDGITTYHINKKNDLPQIYIIVDSSELVGSLMNLIICLMYQDWPLTIGQWIYEK